jgi:hypothetical protein
METVLVAGAIGSIAHCVVKLLLGRNHTTVCNLKNMIQHKYLSDLQTQDLQYLTIFEIDLMKDDFSIEGMKYCIFSHHIAPPFLIPQ